MKNVWLKYIQKSFVEALAAMLIFWVIYMGHSIEIIRSLAGDTAFTTLNSFMFAGKISNNKNDIDKVVTEFGIAQMRGQSARQRALGLIRISHPDFRDELKEAAQAMNLF